MWNGDELRWGLRHMDALQVTRVIDAGTHVHPCRPDRRSPHFAAGTPGGAGLERYLADQRVTGLLILQDGRIRLEGYAADSSPRDRWGDRWRVGEMQECGTWADDRPVRVLLFTLTGPEEARYHGVSAYWRGLNENAWVSFLGLGSSATAQAEFLTMLRTSR